MPATMKAVAAACTLVSLLAGCAATGLLVARGDTILIERYQYGRNDRHRFTSWSMAKTVTSMLVGIAIAEGRIRSVDDPAPVYVPALAGTEYGRTSLRHLLQMSSGARFVEEYSGRDDVARLSAATLGQLSSGGVEAAPPRRSSATATRPGSSRGSGRCSPSSACAVRRSWSIPPVVSSSCTPRSASTPPVQAPASWARSGGPS